MNFPVLTDGANVFPNIACCPQCKRRKVFEPNSMACLNGGAFLMDRRSKSGKADDRLDAFVTIDWHGAHDHGTGEDREIYETVSLAENCRGGQFSLYFCSTKCLRAFLNSWVDALEKKIARQRRNSKSTPR